MKGDKSKPQSSFMRWVDWFVDGTQKVTKKGNKKIPSQNIDKRYNKRWKRRKGKEELIREEQK